MEKLTQAINKEFNNEFNFLRLFEVVYSRVEKVCKICFLYPQKIKEISHDARYKIQEFLKEYLSLDARLEIRFRKSFLDKNLIQDFIINFFKTNNYSLFIATSKERVVVEKYLAEIIVTLNFEKDIYEYIEENQILISLKSQLEKNFIASFTINLEEGESQIDEGILIERQKLIKPQQERAIPRYEVFEPAKLFGSDIEPFPEFISQQKVERSSVILAGDISHVTKKAYKSKFSKNPDEEKFLYTFEINDGTGVISAIHFANKRTLSKAEALADGMSFLFVGDIKKNNYGKLNYQVKSASLAIIKKENVQQAQKEFERQEFLQHDTYRNIFPKPFLDTYQESLFIKRKYTQLIEDNTIIVFDLETTGLEPEFAEIIEIGAVKVVNGELVETFETLVKPKKEISSIITDITGITNDMVKDSPSIEDVMSDFILFTKDKVLSGYNVGFDMRFIQKYANEMGFKFNNRVEDTMRFAREKLTLSNYTLKNVAKNLNISLVGAHRAVNDAVATARVLVKLNKVE